MKGGIHVGTVLGWEGGGGGTLTLLSFPITIYVKWGGMDGCDCNPTQYLFHFVLMVVSWGVGPAYPYPMRHSNLTTTAIPSPRRFPHLFFSLSLSPPHSRASFNLAYAPRRVLLTHRKLSVLVGSGP